MDSFSTSTSATIRNASQDGSGWVEEMADRFPVEYTTAAPPTTSAHVAATSNNPAFGTASRRYKEAQEEVRRTAALKRFANTLCEDEDEFRLLAPGPPIVDLDDPAPITLAGEEEEEMDAVWGPPRGGRLEERASMLPSRRKGKRRAASRRWVARAKSLLFPAYCGAQSIFILGLLLIMVIFLAIPLTVLTQMYDVSSGRESFGLSTLEGPVVTAATLANVNQMFAVLVAIGVSPSSRPRDDGGAHLTYTEVNDLMVDGLGTRSAIPSDLFSSNSDLSDAVGASDTFSSAATIATAVSWMQLLLDPSRLLSGPLSGAMTKPSITQYVDLLSTTATELDADLTEEEASLCLRNVLGELLASTPLDPSSAGSTLLEVSQQDITRVAGMDILKVSLLSLMTSLLDGRTSVAYPMPSDVSPTGLVDTSMSQLSLLGTFQPLLRMATLLCYSEYSPTPNISICDGPTFLQYHALIEGISYTFEHTLLSVMRTLSKIGEGPQGWDPELTEMHVDGVDALVRELYDDGQVFGVPVGGDHTDSTLEEDGFTACNHNLRGRLSSLGGVSKAPFVDSVEHQDSRAQRFLVNEAARSDLLTEFLRITDQSIDMLVYLVGNDTEPEEIVQSSSRTATPSPTNTPAITPTRTMNAEGVLVSPFTTSSDGLIYDTLYALRRARILRLEMSALQTDVERSLGVQSQPDSLLDGIGQAKRDSLRALVAGSDPSKVGLVRVLIGVQKLLEAALLDQLEVVDRHFNEFQEGASLDSSSSYLYLPARAAVNIQVAVTLCSVLPVLILVHTLYGVSLRTGTSFFPHRLLLVVCAGMYLILVVAGGIVAGVGVDAVRAQASYDEDRTHWLAVKRDIQMVAMSSNETANTALLVMGVVNPEDIYELYDGVHRFSIPDLAGTSSPITSSALLTPSMYSSMTSSGVSEGDSGTTSRDAINSTALLRALEATSGNTEAEREQDGAAWRTLQNLTCAAEAMHMNASAQYTTLRWRGCSFPLQVFPLAISALLAPSITHYASNATTTTTSISADFTSQELSDAVLRLATSANPTLIMGAMELVTECEDLYKEMGVPPPSRLLERDPSAYRYCGGTGDPSLVRQRDAATGFLLAGGMTQRIPLALGPFAVPNDVSNSSCLESTGSLSNLLVSGTYLTSAKKTKVEVQALLDGIGGSYVDAALSANRAILLRRRTVVWVSSITLVVLQLVALGVYLLVFEYPTPSSLLL